MPKDPNEYAGNQMPDEEYRRRQAARAKRRRQRRNQRLLLIGAFVLAAALVIVSVILVFNAIFGGKGEPSSSETSSVPSVPSSVPPAPSGPGYDWPLPDPADWQLVLVNAQSALASDGLNQYDGMSVIPGVQGHRVAQEMFAPLMDMVAACNAAVEGGSLEVAKGWRSFERQSEDYYAPLLAALKAAGHTDAEADRLARMNEPPAPYGEHSTGLAVDFQTTVVPLTLVPTPPSPAATAFSQTPEYAWLLEHAHEYGFILRYPEDKVAITGMDFQPFHFRFVGTEHAALIKQNNLCLEEYLNQTPPSVDGGASGGTQDASGDAAGPPPDSGSDSDSGSGQMG